MIDVCVGQEDCQGLEPLALDKRQQVVDFIAGIDQHGLARPFASEHETVLGEWRDCCRLENHECRIPS